MFSILITSQSCSIAREGDIRRNIEEHAIGLAVPEALALGVGFAECLAGSERILRAAGLEVICWRRLYVGYDAAANGSGDSEWRVSNPHKQAQGLGRTVMAR